MGSNPTGSAKLSVLTCIVYEPKYKLNKKDAARYNALLVRHCLEAPFSAPGVPAKPNPKYPPLTPEENEEFERLHRKERRKLNSHPKMQQSLRRQRYLLAKTDKLATKLKRMIARMKKKKVIKN